MGAWVFMTLEAMSQGLLGVSGYKSRTVHACQLQLVLCPCYN